MVWSSRGKKILEQLSRTRFLTLFEVPVFSLHLRSREKRAGFSNHVKNRVLESCSNIFFPLVCVIVGKIQQSSSEITQLLFIRLVALQSVKASNMIQVWNSSNFENSLCRQKILIIYCFLSWKTENRQQLKQKETYVCFKIQQ